MPEQVAPGNRSGSPDAESPRSAWAVSLLFWSILLLAAALYATVAVAPKLSIWMRVRHQYRSNAQQLSALEAEVDYLERVQEALETDPDFLQRLATASRSPDEESGEWIPVNRSLMFGRGKEETRVPAADRNSPAFAAPVAMLASHRRLRTGLLLTSCGLVVFAFTFLNDAGHGLVRSTLSTVGKAIRVPVARYVRKQDAPAAVEPTNDKSPKVA